MAKVTVFYKTTLYYEQVVEVPDDNIVGEWPNQVLLNAHETLIDQLNYLDEVDCESDIESVVVHGLTS
jgi:hypothetical protein